MHNIILTFFLHAYGRKISQEALLKRKWAHNLYLFSFYFSFYVIAGKFKILHQASYIRSSICLKALTTSDAGAFVLEYSQHISPERSNSANYKGSCLKEVLLEWN